MAKLPAIPLDAAAVWERTRKAANIDNLSKLAGALGISPQALNQSLVRRSISLPLMMLASELSNKTIDYLLYGGDEENNGDVTRRVSREESIEDQKLVNVPRIGGGVVKFPQELFHRSIDISKLSAYIKADKLWIIDTADVIVTTGVYAIGNPDRPTILRCKQLSNGDVLFEGEATPKSNDDLVDIYVIGMVVWAGNAES